MTDPLPTPPQPRAYRLPAAVVPAAGASRRMGRPKLLLPWGTGTVIDATLAALREGGVRRVTVVTAAGGPLAGWQAPAGVTLAENPDVERGMLSSVQAGLRLLLAREPLPPDPLVVCPADLPALRASTVATLLAAQRRHGGLVVPSYQGKRGHPLLVPPRWQPAILQLDDAVGLRQLLALAAADLLRLPVDDPGTVRDVDTPEAYDTLRPR